ncbi:MAG TPA: phosphoenolpyruvate--protein phosphotransferase [Steroidobacteraceae bacterium]
MKHPDVLTLLAPLAGWSTPLDEAPDEVFAARLLGDGVAIDPTAGTLHAPCDGEIVLLPATRHAVTLRTDSGCEILLHVGIDTVALAGEGFEAHVHQGIRVRAGDVLLSFDLDFLARRAKSVLTPIIVTADSGCDIRRRSLDRPVEVGEWLMEIAPRAPAAAAVTSGARAAGSASRRLAVGFEHGIHARPAALLAGSLRTLAADVRLLARGREANARSTVALMALGVQRGEEIEIRATGPDAQNAVNALAAVFAHGSTPPALAGPGLPRAPAAAVAPVHTEAPAERAVAAAPAATGSLKGVVASAGLAVGPALQLRRPEIRVREQGAGVAQENAALDRARAEVRARLERRALASPSAEAGAGAGAASEIAAAHLELLDDPELLAAARAAIEAGGSAGFAWRAAVRASAATLEALTDARLRERADDLLDLESQVLVALDGSAAGTPIGIGPAAHTILIARELLPSQLIALDEARVAGIAMAAGGATSHAAILAAAMGIPALVALGPALLAVPDGTPLVLDAGRGVLEVDPGETRLAAALAEVAALSAQRVALAAAAQRECRTADGTRIEVLANIGSLTEAQAAVRNGAEGCGLLRTEFLFLDRLSAPTEAEQSAEYQKIADVLGARPLTIRTLDAGGDKPIAYLPLPEEENPALGLRGVRTSLAFPELLRTQLRAVLAVRRPAQCRLLLPMISDVEEIQAVRGVLDELCRELGRVEPLSVGVMIETPAAAVLAERIATVADFLSIGTNDLTQYTLAMDRGHPQLAGRLDALHPAVLRLIARSAEGARAHGRHAAVCGGLASEPLAAPLLVGLGVQELSAVPGVIPQLKARLRSVSLSDCRALAQQALEQPSAAAVRALALRAFPTPADRP